MDPMRRNRLETTVARLISALPPPISPMMTKTSLGFEDLQMLAEVRAADPVQDDVHAPPFGEFKDAGGKILGLVVDSVGCTQVEAALEFFVGSGGGDGGHAPGMSQLKGGRSHSASSSMNQQSFSGLHPGFHKQVVESREKNFRRRCGGHKIEIIEGSKPGDPQLPPHSGRNRLRQ